MPRGNNFKSFFCSFLVQLQGSYKSMAVFLFPLYSYPIERRCKLWRIVRRCLKCSHRPYAPELNPIESVFGLVKQRLIREW